MNQRQLNMVQRNNSSTSAESADVIAAKLAVIAGALTTFAEPSVRSPHL